MNKRVFILIIAFVITLDFVAISGLKRKAILINRIEVQGGSQFSYGNNLSAEIIDCFRLKRANFNNIYSYWTFSNASTQRTSALARSVVSKFNSQSVDVSINLRGEELTIGFKNKTSMWLALDISSISYYISYFENGIKIDYSGSEFAQTMGTLFNYHRGEYDLVLFPPYAKSEFSYFRVDGAMNGYEIISPCIKDNSRLVFNIPIYVFSSDPFTSNKSYMRNKKTYWYSQETPIKKRMQYKGAYFMDGKSIYIHNNSISSLDSYYELLNLKFVCDVDVSNDVISTIKNKYGLNVYSK